ncbi:MULTISPECIES: transcriptional activator NhaR [Hydrogenophaga]|jgi:LysR family transcriptional activator of nhaA|uniref:LysR family transcriptional activator of nhaA n=1 Tax=Hydrogenophaga laconesensis TaxID=1805971 RepID=A0ABU1VJ16_9BURK|nr:transcriptional activator NhaR [Hydrogenophaga laconesensis]MDR7097481.1 LysR family transcriptional activator of nhaA [Hydrogenophaga laconesensis]
MNYKHLHYFWTVLRAGSIARASAQLHLTPQTLSGQIKLLEARLGKPLLRKVGRGVEPTDTGRMVQRFADEIFSIGAALQDALSTGQEDVARGSLRVGVVDSVPKSIACHVLEPVLAMPDRGRLVCVEGKLTALLAELAVHRLDLVVSDVPMPASLSVKAFTHLLGKTDISFFASPQLLQREGLTLRQARSRFPECLGKLPWLMPNADSVLRPRLDAWLGDMGVVPRIVAEFDDGALTKAFGRQGFGVFAGPAVLASEIEDQYQVARLGTTHELMEEFYAISIERRISNPAVAAITAAARRELFPKN